MNCPKCNAYLENKASSFLYGTEGREAHPKYVCPNCGRIKLQDLPENERKEIMRQRKSINRYILFVGLLIAVIGLLYRFLR